VTGPAAYPARATAPDGRSRVPPELPSRLRLLYVYPDNVGLSADPLRNPLHYLSKHFEGDFLSVWIVPDAAAARERAPAIEAASGRFRYHWIRRNRLPRLLQRMAQVWFHVRTAIRMSRRHGRYHVIVAHGPFSMALSGLILRRITGAPLIVEFPGHPFRGFELEHGFVNAIKRRLAPRWARFIAIRADHLRLLYPAQLEDLGLDVGHKSSVFHEFTVVSSGPPGGASDATGDPYVLFVGYPYHLKGVDVLIEAFRRIADGFPGHRLVIVGHCPDPAPWTELIGGDPRIEMHDALPHEDVMRLMAGCTAFVLPSRTEAMGRVLLEAMALGKPVIASAVGGIPHYVENNATGLLFESGSIPELADRMERVLGDPDLARRLGERGRAHVLTELSEARYASHFRSMAEQALSRSGRNRTAGA
jgi:glycosyltransferase involved in cell wall biosynthesis